MLSLVDWGRTKEMPTTVGGHIELGNVTPHNIRQLKKLNSVVFPIAYTDKFYKDVLELGDMAKLAYYNDLVVGAVCCRVETEGDKHKMYIMTLGCLAPYRRLGIGTALLNHVLQKAREHGNIDNIYLHVQVNNEDALAFYRKFDFHSVETKEQYYKRIDPPHAHVLQKDMRTSQAVADPPAPPEPNVTDTEYID